MAVPLNANGLPYPQSEMRLVTVQPNQRVELNISGQIYVYTAGQTLYIPVGEYTNMNLDGIVV